MVHHLDLGDLHLPPALPHPPLTQHHHLQEAQGTQGSRRTTEQQPDPGAGRDINGISELCISNTADITI